MAASPAVAPGEASVVCGLCIMCYSFVVRTPARSEMFPTWRVAATCSIPDPAPPLQRVEPLQLCGRLDAQPLLQHVGRAIDTSLLPFRPGHSDALDEVALRQEEQHDNRCDHDCRRRHKVFPACGKEALK